MKHIIFIVILCLVGIPTFSQSHVVRGKVTDKEQAGEPIIGCTVVEYDKDMRIVGGSITNTNGEYIIEISSREAVIGFSFIGYKSITMKAEERTVIDIELASEAMQMEEVMIVAAKRSSDPYSNIVNEDRTGARAIVDMSEISTAGITSVDEALQGQVTGLSIVSSGDPGSGGSIVIRGLGTLSSSQPLIVTDGIPQDVRISSDFDFAAANVEDISNLVNIAPQDIKSIVVLKDAAETAVWGSRGANGVLLIETLAGIRGDTRFNYSVKLTRSIPAPSIPMLNGNEYIMLQLEEQHAPNGIYSLHEHLSADPAILGPEFYNYTQNTDWVDAVTQNGAAYEHYFKVSGGGDKTQFFTSINYLDESGTVINTGLKRLSARANLNFKLSNKLRLITRFQLSTSDRRKNINFRFAEGAYRSSGVLAMAEKKAPNMSIWEYDSEGNLTGSYFTPENSYQGSGTNYYNPAAMATLGYDDMSSNNVETTYDLNYMLRPRIKLNQTITYTVLGSQQKAFTPESAIGADWLYSENNKNYKVNRANTRWMFRSTASLGTFIFGSHTMSGTMVFETDQQVAKYTSMMNTLNSSDYFNDPAAGGRYLWNSNNSSRVRRMGFFVQGFYKFKDRYMLTANIRHDISSMLSAQNRGATFPGISVGWRFSEEPFMQDLAFLGESKIRASYGFNGKLHQQLQAYSRHASYSTTAASWSAYNDNPVVVPTQVQLDNFGWERIRQLNFGTDISLFKDKLTVIADWYVKNTSNLIWRKYAIPSSAGFSEIGFFNGGELENRGWELSLNWKFFQSAKWNVSFNANISHNINKFLSFPDNYNNVFSTTLDNGEFPRRFNLGEPIGSFYGLQYQGVWPTTESVHAYDAEGNILTDINGEAVPFSFNNTYLFAGGDAIYNDINNDGVIDINDAVYIGNANPEYEGGFGTNIKYRELIFNLSFYFRQGFEILNYRAVETQGMNDRNNQSMAVLKRWRTEGDDFEGMLPRAYYNHPANNVGSDRYVEDGSFMRINNLSVKYDLPKNLVSKINIKRMSVGIYARRLFTLTRYTGQDPEITRDIQDPSWFGVDRGRTPPPMKYGISFDIAF